jgi:protein-tyrosine phosphatase
MRRVIRINFVCLGNICRSPMAEGVFKHLAAQAGLSDRFDVESSAIGGWHVGEPYDPRARRAAQAHGVQLHGAPTQIKPRDFDRFDWLIALDEDIAASLQRLAPAAPDREKIRLLREFDPEANGDLDVPDPYYGGPEEFERVYQIVERACRGLLDELKAKA